MKNTIRYTAKFDSVGDEGRVFEIYPNIFGDNRGFFTEVFNSEDRILNCPRVLRNGINWIKQVNRSSSSSFVIRGLHAQVGRSCQAKMVEAINRVIYDFIVDARPDSRTFGNSEFFKLDPEKQNKLFVPRGFLHGFLVPGGSDEKAFFNYYCDNNYRKSSEIGISPKTYIPGIFPVVKEAYSNNQDYDMLMGILDKQDSLVYSEKDLSGLDFVKFMVSVETLYKNSNVKWYSDDVSRDLVLDNYKSFDV